MTKVSEPNDSQISQKLADQPDKNPNSKVIQAEEEVRISFKILHFLSYFNTN